jgi:hypothetical protein
MLLLLLFFLPAVSQLCDFSCVSRACETRLLDAGQKYKLRRKNLDNMSLIETFTFRATQADQAMKGCERCVKGN